MTRIMNFLKTIRNNWKKSVAGAAALSYGVSYSIEKYDTDQLMREYCKEAAKYGDESLPVNSRPRQMVVVLNPVANKRTAKLLFEKYCEPLLHLAGIAITVIQTESEGQARHILSKIDSPTDAVIVAGGDGTLSDVVTGLMRRYEHNIGLVKQCPIGILPLGQTNTIAGSLYQGYEDLKEVRALADATMAIVKGNTKSLDTVKVEPLEQDLENTLKPVYALGSIEWGAWKDAYARIDKYWYYGFLRKYATYIFSGYKTDLSWNCDATLRYTDPCNGCSHCYKEKLYSNASTASNQRWWHVFLPRKKIYSSDSEIDYSKVINEKCGNFHEIPISTTELCIETLNTNNIESEAKSLLDVKLAPTNIDYSKFVAEGWKRVEGSETLIDKEIYAKEIELYPKTTPEEEKETLFYIDNEAFELKPIKMKLLEKSVNIFCPESKR